MLLREGHRWVAAIDEVGRGSLAGPVTVGVVVVDAATRSAPAGVRDSKLLTPQARLAIAPRLRRWAPMHAVAHASAAEIDRIGIVGALRLAGARALDALPVRPDCALLDGSHDWLTGRSRAAAAAPLTNPPPQQALFDVPAPGPAPAAGQPDVVLPHLVHVRAQALPARVVTRVKADLRCAAVAAASVLAKVERDAIMVDLAPRFPAYGWHLNKGYSAPEHIAALREHGPCVLHRRSWNLPGLLALPDAVLDGLEGVDGDAGLDADDDVSEGEQFADDGADGDGADDDGVGDLPVVVDLDEVLR